MVNRKYLYILSTIVICFLSFYYRYIPFLYFQKEKIQQLAQDNVMNQLYQAVSKQISENFPDQSDQEKQQMINKAINQVITTKRSDIKQKVLDHYAHYKKTGFQRPDYLIAADSYYYLGLVKKLIKYGKFSDNIKNGEYFNPLMMAPKGHLYLFDLHPYVSFFTYKILHIFRNDLSLINTLAFTSPILVILTLLIFLYYLYTEKTSPFCAFVTALLFSFAPMYFQRSLYGWFDTDPYNCLFPIVIIILTIAMYSQKKTILQRSVYCLVNAIIMSLYTFFWSGWTYVLACFMLIFILLILMNLYKKNFLEIKRSSFLFFGTIFLSFMFICLFKGYHGLMLSLENTYSRLLKFSQTNFKLWPDAFITVGELKKISLQKMAVLAGGRIFALVSLFSIPYLFIKYTNENKHKIIILFSFFLVPFFMTKNAERFSILLTVPLCFLFAYVFDHLLKTAGKKLKLTVYCFLSFLLLSSLLSTYAIARKEQPVIYNETWNNVMEYIKQNTPQNAIINTWWSPGHFITSMAERGAVIDGATLEQPSGYWISKALLSPDERESLGILRMLDVSGNSAVSLLEDNGLSLSEAVDHLSELFVLSPEKGEFVIKKMLTEKDADALYDCLYSTPSSSYLLIYNGLVESAIGIKFMGAWDFKKAESFNSLIKKDPGKANDIMKYNFDDNYIRLLWDFSGYPTYYEDPSYMESIIENKIYFSNGLILDTSNMTFTFSGKKKGFERTVKKLIYLKNDEIIEKSFNQNGKISILLFQNEKGNGNIIAENSIIESLLFKLYFFQGRGLTHFKLVKHSISRDKNTDIYLFEILWNK
ncbi:MAG: STT3 domain-containing protein [Candidatus Omnitrophica bacterium]|nr:STT3 domain-containing protein [Candidatus Omnitrophota bacterium]